jgi:hypothetical protein
MTQDGIKLHFVFDGSANLIKKQTKEGRRGKRRDAESWLENFYDTNRESKSGTNILVEDHLKVKKAMKASSFPDEIVLNEVITWMKADEISFESAPLL